MPLSIRNDRSSRFGPGQSMADPLLHISGRGVSGRGLHVNEGFARRAADRPIRAPAGPSAPRVFAAELSRLPGIPRQITRGQPELDTEPPIHELQVWGPRVWCILRAVHFGRAAMLDDGQERLQAERPRISSKPRELTLATFEPRPRPEGLELTNTCDYIVTSWQNRCANANFYSLAGNKFATPPTGNDEFNSR